MIVVYRKEDSPEDYAGKKVFLPRPVRKDMLEKLLEVAEKVYMPPSTYNRISKNVREMWRYKIAVTSSRGRYSSVDIESLKHVLVLSKSGLSIRRIAEETGLPKSTVHYILRYMKKIRIGDTDIILRLSLEEPSNKRTAGQQ